MSTDLSAEEAAIRLGGGAKAVERQHEKGRLTARERITKLLDPNSDLFELGLWAAPWVVYFRDVTQALDYGLLCWMYLTPVVYSIAVVPEHLRPLYWANPLTACVQGLRWAVFGVGEAPGLISAVAAGVVVLLALTGALAFGRRERSIVDVI